MYKNQAILTSLILLSSCVPLQEEKPPMTSLQIREAQTRDLETSNMKLVMKTMMNVLQDEGYMIKNAVLDLGLLSAEKNIDIESKSEVFIACMSGAEAPRWKKQEIIEASANVSEFGDKVRVRINFQKKQIDNFGCPQNVKTILDPGVYQDFFEKVSKALFLQKEKI